MNEHTAYAQMIEDHCFGNRTSGLQEEQEMKINGTINLEQTIIEAIDSKVNTSLTQVITHCRAVDRQRLFLVIHYC